DPEPAARSSSSPSAKPPGSPARTRSSVSAMAPSSSVSSRTSIQARATCQRHRLQSNASPSVTRAVNQATDRKLDSYMAEQSTTPFSQAAASRIFGGAAQPAAPPPELGISGFTFADLFSPYGLRRLYDAWLAELQDGDAALLARYLAYRDGQALDS